jgi:hypothetical protein
MDVKTQCPKLINVAHRSADDEAEHANNSRAICQVVACRPGPQQLFASITLTSPLCAVSITTCVPVQGFGPGSACAAFGGAGVRSTVLARPANCAPRSR